jgi:ABC-type polar amino acid transport system ATPase subunit/GNAT superfamily N-acetyltransferase
MMERFNTKCNDWNEDIMPETESRKLKIIEALPQLYKYIKEQFTGNIDIEGKDWAIGLIVGSSGTGKSTIAKQVFSEHYIHSFEYDENSVLDNMPENKTTEEITKTFNSVGFATVWSWLKPYNVLSNGEKMRVDLARAVLSDKETIVFDEFTSVVDRDVAKIGSAAISKALRRKESPPFIAVSCHYDVIDWLDPDWVYDVGAQRFEWRSRRRFPQISLSIHKTSTSSWSIFREHHYLNKEIHQAAQCFVATWDGKPVAFCSVLHFPHPKCTIMKREHRTVVLPDFQGVGIGNRLSEFVADYYKQKGFRFISTTSAPAMMSHRSKSAKWRCSRLGTVTKGGEGKACGISAQRSIKRVTAGFEFIG